MNLSKGDVIGFWEIQYIIKKGEYANIYSGI